MAKMVWAGALAAHGGGLGGGVGEFLRTIRVWGLGAKTLRKCRIFDFGGLP